MKFVNGLILAGLLLASRASAQSEQWLQYHTSKDGLTDHLLDLTRNPPPGIALPKLGAAPYFARWTTPMDPSGGRWLVLDRSRRSGPYDRLYIDTTGDGRLDNKTVIPGRRDSEQANFPPVALTFKGEDGPITYHLVFRFYQYDNDTARLYLSSGGWYEGQVNFDGQKRHVKLVDANVNGTFNDILANPFESDRLEIAGDAVSERYLGKYVEVNGKLFEVEVARDGAFLKVKKAENVAMGSVQVPQNISEFIAHGPNGHFVRQPVNGVFTLPAGHYHLVHWTINRRDDHGIPWTLSGHDFPDSATFDVASGSVASLDIGEPSRALLSSSRNGPRDITIGLRFVGHQQEAVEMLKNGARPTGPKFTLTGADGAMVFSKNFEFG